MEPADLKVDTAYIISKGKNDTFEAGDIIWIDSLSGHLNNLMAGGCLDADDLQGCFDGVEVELANLWRVETRQGSSRVYKIR